MLDNARIMINCEWREIDVAAKDNRLRRLLLNPTLDSPYRKDFKLLNLFKIVNKTCSIRLDSQNIVK